MHRQGPDRGVTQRGRRQHVRGGHSAPSVPLPPSTLFCVPHVPPCRARPDPPRRLAAQAVNANPLDDQLKLFGSDLGNVRCRSPSRVGTPKRTPQGSRLLVCLTPTHPHTARCQPHQVTLVGKLVNVENAATQAVYTLDDGTGAAAAWCCAAAGAAERLRRRRPHTPVTLCDTPGKIDIKMWADADAGPVEPNAVVRCSFHCCSHACASLVC